MGKLMVGGMFFLSFCALMLALPVATAAQCISPFAVQHVWTQDTAGNNKTAFAPGEPIRFVAQVESFYGGSGQTQLAIATSIYNDTKTVNIPIGISTWPWNATAPSQQGSLTVTVKVLDRFCGWWVERSASFTVGSGVGTTVTLERALTHNGEGTYGQEQTIFTPGEVIRYAAIVNNPGNSTVTPKFDFQATGPRAIFSWISDVPIAPGLWRFHLHTSVPADAPVGTYTLRVTMTSNGQATTKQSSFSVQSPLSPGWYRNSGAGGSYLIYDDTRLRIMWQNSYVYKYPGNSPLYWYAQVIYSNLSSEPLPLTCAGRTNPSLVKEHMRGTANAGFVAAEETFCSRNPSFTTSLKPGETHYEWAIFHNVPWKGGEVSLEWMPYGFSATWVNPWHSPFSDPPPVECPPELVTLGTCQPVSKTPEGKASNLVVLVHGCCTDGTDVRNVWENLGRHIAGTIQTPGAWEIVVLDWHDDTPKQGDYINLLNPGLGLNWLIIDANKAYDNAGEPGKSGQGSKLADAIADAINKSSVAYRYVHLIGHSAGARLIHGAAYSLANKNLKKRPFIHLTFLDAYTRTKEDSGEEAENGIKKGYGYLENYTEHYAEHYVDKSLFNIADATLASAFNFDITGWKDEKDNAEFGHRWPRIWYARSIKSPDKTGILGFKLSLEGGYEAYSTLSQRFEPGKNCQLTDVFSTVLCGIKLPASLQ